MRIRAQLPLITGGRRLGGCLQMKGDPSDIRNWQRRPDGITTSGKLEEADPPRLAAIGIKHVINLAMDDHPEALPNEAALMAQAGMGYTHIPVPFNAPTRDHALALRAALDKAAGPVHVHCIANYRVTAFLYLLDQESGVTEAEARATMTKVWDPLSSDDPRVLPWRALLA